MDGSKKITGIVFAGIIAFALTACKVQLPGYVGLYEDNLISVTDHTDSGVTTLNMEDSLMTHVADTPIVMETELSEFLNPAEKVDFNQLMQDNNDTIAMLRKQMHVIQNNKSIKTDTILVVKKTTKLPGIEGRQTVPMTAELNKARNEQTQVLPNKLNSVHNPAARAPQPTYITGERAQVPPGSRQQTDQLTRYLLQAQKDTIQLLRTQLRNPQLQARKRDSVYIKEEPKELQPAKELVAELKAPDTRKLQDTIQLLETRVLNLNEHTPQFKDTQVLAMQDKTDVTYTALTNTTLIIAFYERGEIKPIEEDVVLKQIKKICSNNNTKAITLSGYTDSSGSKSINKVMTNRRLDYLSEAITPWIAKEKIFFQNFGDIFASEMIVSDERRIEIRIVQN